MNYLFLAFADNEQAYAQTTAQRERFLQACRANEEALRQSGHLLAVADVESVDTAVTVRVRDGSLGVAAGANSEAEETLVALFFISARDLNEAIQVAAKMPQAGRGAISVRPLRALDQNLEK